jgi:hypothetical protein
MVQTRMSDSVGPGRPTLIIGVLPFPVVVGTWSSPVAQVNLHPYLGQAAPLEEVSVPLADPVKREEGMLRPAALGAEYGPGEAVMTSLSTIPVAQTAHPVLRWGLLPQEDVKIILRPEFPLPKILVWTLDSGRWAR